MQKMDNMLISITKFKKCFRHFKTLGIIINHITTHTASVILHPHALMSKMGGEALMETVT
jgi:hypothetical protein